MVVYHHNGLNKVKIVDNVVNIPPGTINYIKTQRLSWFGHLHRMPEEGMFKKVYKLKPVLTKPLGRPNNNNNNNNNNNRWEDDIRSGMKKLKTKNWTNCIQDRNNWKLHAEKAKTFND